MLFFEKGHHVLKRLDTKANICYTFHVLKGGEISRSFVEIVQLSAYGDLSDGVASRLFFKRIFAATSFPP